MAAIYNLHLVELASRLRERELSPTEVIEAHIARIEAVNPTLNAVVTTAFDRARDEAQRAQTARDRGERIGPLFGVPFTIKDCHATGGIRTTSGLVSRREHVPEHDSYAVARLRAAGAILLGKTNLAENCWSGDTTNPLFGTTNNPWDPKRTVGGSSGGSAAIVAACGVPFDVGSDIGGSIRLPACYTGVVGLRVTSGTISEEGMWPATVGRLVDLESIGPIARRVADAALVYDVLRDGAPTSLAPSALRGARVAAWYGDRLASADADVRSGVDAVVKALEDAGMVRADGAPREREGALFGWLAYFDADTRAAVRASFGGGPEWSPLAELGRWLVGRGRISTPALLAWLTSEYGPPLARLVIDADRWRARLRAELAELIGEGGVAVCPVRPGPAPTHGLWNGTLGATRISNLHAWVNFAGLPAMSVPVGFSSRDDLPIGVQIVGNPGSERTVLAAGRVVEEALMPTWRGPSLP